MSSPTATEVRASRRPVARGTKIDFWLDAALFVAFALDYSFRFTGLTVHEWIGIGLAGPLVVHITLHWDWVVRTARKLVQSYAGREKIRWVLDLALIGAMTLCIGSGILISRSALPAIGITTARDPFWTGLHTTTADVCIALVGLHLALSWRWIVAVGRRLLPPGRMARGAGR
ncbi:MAG: DUF4405 domain-containing protein [Acidimicrobiia bacterium]